MVPSSPIAITTDGKRLVCGGFSLSEPICLGNFEFIANYFNGLSLSSRRDTEGTVIMGSTHSGGSTPQWATIEDSAEEFLIASSGGGSFCHPSPRRRNTGAPFASTTTATWKENAPATTRFPPWTVEPQPKTNHPSEWHRAHHEGQPMQARARHPTADPGTASRRSHLTEKQTATVVQPDTPPRCEPALKTERFLMVDFTSTQAQAKEMAPPVHREEAQGGAIGAKSQSTLPPLIIDGVDMMYHQLAKIHAIAKALLAECARWCRTDLTPHSVRAGIGQLRPGAVPSATRLVPSPSVDFMSQATLWPR
jgi:hypothetical protein